MGKRKIWLGGAVFRMPQVRVQNTNWPLSTNTVMDAGEQKTEHPENVTSCSICESAHKPETGSSKSNRASDLTMQTIPRMYALFFHKSVRSKGSTFLRRRMCAMQQKELLFNDSLRRRASVK